MKNKAIVAGILAGALVGTCAALLLASDKGSEVRKKLADQLKQLGSQKAKMVRDNVQEKLSRTSSRVDALHRDVQGAIN